MSALFRLCLCVAAVCSSPSPERCGDVRSGVHSGVVRPPDPAGRTTEELNCSWTYTAPPDRKLLVKVDSVQLPAPDVGTSSLQLFVDERRYDVPRNCVQCLKETVGGERVRVTFTSRPGPRSSLNASLEEDSTPSARTVGSFQIRFKSFDPYRCDKPRAPDNGYVIDKGWKLHQEISYHCNPPYDLVGEANATCAVSRESPVPDWNVAPPKCTVRNCSRGTVRRDAGAGAIAHPGYPGRIALPPAPCRWEIETKTGHIRASLTYLRNPGGRGPERVTRLELFDGSTAHPVPSPDPSEDRAQPFQFTTRTNKLIVRFSGSADKTEGGRVGFYLEYSAVESSCPHPGAPDDGEVVAYGLTVGSIVSFRCASGYALEGESHAECLSSGRWSAARPSCRGPVSAGSEVLMAASNRSDTITADLTEPPVPSRPTQGPDRKLLPSKTPTKPAVKGSRPHHSQETTDVFPEKPPHTSKSGPKSEPHQQRIVPQEPGRPRQRQRPEPDPEEEGEEPPAPKEEGEEAGVDGSEFSLTVIVVVAGVAGPLLIALVVLAVLLVYRKRYPVRMRFGRKFSTFENPMYVRKDAQHPRELKRLTA